MHLLSIASLIAIATTVAVLTDQLFR